MYMSVFKLAITITIFYHHPFPPHTHDYVFDVDEYIDQKDIYDDLSVNTKCKNIERLRLRLLNQEKNKESNNVNA
jgi:hypothetical protein